MKKIYFVLIMAMAYGQGLFSQTMEVTITPTSDNTIFLESDLSNGLGEFFFAGTSNEEVVKRALVKFTLSQDIPDGVTIDSAKVILYPVKVKPGTTSLDVHLLTTQWGEGTSKAEDGDGKGAPATIGDATWNFAMYNSVPWVKVGGDFALEKSASFDVSLGENAVFSSERITLDVNYWLQNPTRNYGWILIGDESAKATSVKFVSKDNPEQVQWPKLKLYYEGTSSITRFDESASKLTVYQGSALNSIHIRNTGDPTSSTVNVYSITGTRIYSNQLELSSGENTIETDIREPGIYVYRIITEEIPTSGKLMIQDR